FQNYMKKEVFAPLGMDQSTFDISRKPAIKQAQVFKRSGEVRPMNKFTALAAASLFSSTSDLAKFMKAHISQNPVLSQESLDQMSRAETFINDTGIYGLGPHLYSQKDKNSKIIGHDGSGNDAINTAARIDLFSKNGIIILETGHPNLASTLADEWMFLKAGIADYVVMQRNIPYLLWLLGIGYVLIITMSILIIRNKNKARKTNLKQIG
ncbi:MAG: serine hydrolase domain-containing protein, partial [Bacteroidota bacterium]